MYVDPLLSVVDQIAKNNEAKKRNPLKVAGVLQRQPIIAVNGAKFTIL